AQKEIGNNIEVITKCEILVNGLDTQAGSDLRAGNLDWLALDEDLTRISRSDTGDRFDQGRFTGAIVTDQPNNFPRIDLKINVCKRPYCAKGFVDAAHEESWFTSCRLLRYRRRHITGRRSNTIGHRPSIQVKLQIGSTSSKGGNLCRLYHLQIR